MNKADLWFNRFYKAAAVTAMICLIIPITCLIFAGGLFRVSSVCILTVLCVLIGYGLQTLYGIMTNHKRLAVTYAYEDDMSKFRSSQAIVPIIIAFVIALIVRTVVDKMMITYANTTEGAYYDPYSLTPYAAAVLVFLVILSGIAIWFYSPVRIAQIKVIFPAIAVMAIEYGLTFYAGSGVSKIFTLCGIIFFTCSVILLNQVYIQRTFKGTVVSVITPKARFFNIRLCLAFILCICLVFGALFIFFTGISILIKIILFFILINVLRESPTESKYYEASEGSSEFIQMVFGKGNEAADQQFIFAVFILIALIVLLLIIFRKHLSLKKLYAKFHEWIQNILAFLMNAYDFNKISSVKSVNYKDEEEKIQNAKINPYLKSSVNIKTYRDFQHHMSRLKTYDEKLGFAYRTLLQMYQKLNLKLKSSDTPRETKRKVHSGLEAMDISEITEAIELVKYAEVKLDQTDRTKADMVLDTMCGIIKKYMY